MISFGRRNKSAATDSSITSSFFSRSSTASHYSVNYETITAGTADDSFYGIPLDVVVDEYQHYFISQNLLQLGMVLILVVVLLMKPHLSLWKDPDYSFFFGVFILVVTAWQMKELTYYPIIATIIRTRTTYPYLVVVPHCLMAAAAHRRDKQQQLVSSLSSTTTTTTTTIALPRIHYLSSIGMGFLCYGFGGSILSDLLMGLPITALGHARIVPCWIVSWLIIWFSPYDYMYNTLTNDKSSIIYYVCSTMEAIDAITTPMGRISRSARELRNQSTAPILAGLLAGIGGAIIRYGERIINHHHHHPDNIETIERTGMEAIENGVWKTLGYSLLWWYIAVHKCVVGAYDNTDNDNHSSSNTNNDQQQHDQQQQQQQEYHCTEFNGNNTHRFLIVITYVLWNFANDIGIGIEHPFITMGRVLRSVGGTVASVLHLGPPSIPQCQLHHNHVNKNNNDDMEDVKRKHD